MKIEEVENWQEVNMSVDSEEIDKYMPELPDDFKEECKQTVEEELDRRSEQILTQYFKENGGRC